MKKKFSVLLVVFVFAAFMTALAATCGDGGGDKDKSLAGLQEKYKAAGFTAISNPIPSTGFLPSATELGSDINVREWCEEGFSAAKPNDSNLTFLIMKFDTKEHAEAYFRKVDDLIVNSAKPYLVSRVPGSLYVGVAIANSFQTISSNSAINGLQLFQNYDI